MHPASGVARWAVIGGEGDGEDDHSRSFDHMGHNLATVVEVCRGGIELDVVWDLDGDEESLHEVCSLKGSKGNDAGEGVRCLRLEDLGVGSGDWVRGGCGRSKVWGKRRRTLLGPRDSETNDGDLMSGVWASIGRLDEIGVIICLRKEVEEVDGEIDGG